MQFIFCRTVPCLAAMFCGLLLSDAARAQSIQFPWSGYAHDSQHGAASMVASQPMNRILWQTPVDLNPSVSKPIHYGSSLITRSNTVIVPVKTGTTGGFRVEALAAANGRTNWMRATDYTAPTSSWTPSYSPALTPKNRLYFPGGGGTVYYCDTPDTTNTSPAIGQIAFYGLANFIANSNSFLDSVLINTPITSDRYGNIFFGFHVNGFAPLNLHSGIARIDQNGTGTWITTTDAAADSGISKVALNCAPALSNDHQTLYVAVNSANNGYGYLVALDSRTLAPLARVRLKDVVNINTDARIPDIGTASPTIGPDGDVYYGVLENPASSNHGRGWLLHFNGTLQTSKIPGAFGWDDTASIVPATMVPSYSGGSSYLLMTKYNNYAGTGIGTNKGDGVNKIAILDPQASMTDPITGATVMKEVLTVAGPTPDPGKTNAYPNAVREWCINTAAVDAATKSILVNSEDGNMYRWDLTSNKLTETVDMTAGRFEAYTPTIIGVDGTVYAINDATLFVIGR